VIRSWNVFACRKALCSGSLRIESVPRSPKPTAALSRLEQHAVTARIGPPVRYAVLQGMHIDAGSMLAGNVF